MAFTDLSLGVELDTGLAVEGDLTLETTLVSGPVEHWEWDLVSCKPSASLIENARHTGTATLIPICPGSAWVSNFLAAAPLLV
jgi:hypothetical protein